MIISFIILIIVSYYSYEYDNFRDVDCNNIVNNKNDVYVDNNINNTNVDKINTTDYKTLNNQGYECLKWENSDIAVKASDGQIMCASLDGKNCINDCQENYDLPITLGQPLVCGDYHKKIYDFTGFDDSAHWCYIYRDMMQNNAFDKDSLIKYDDKTNLYSGDKVALVGGRNNNFCADDSRWMQCNREGIDFWEQFIIEKVRQRSPKEEIKHGDVIYIKGIRQQKYCSYGEDRTIKCIIKTPGLWEKFIIENITSPDKIIKNNDRIALKSLKTQKYCSDTHNNGDNNKVISCENNFIGKWEAFRIIKLDTTN